MTKFLDINDLLRAFMECSTLKNEVLPTRRSFNTYVTLHWKKEKRSFSTRPYLQGPINSIVIDCIYFYLADYKKLLRSDFNKNISTAWSKVQHRFVKESLPVLNSNAKVLKSSNIMGGGICVLGVGAGLRSEAFLTDVYDSEDPFAEAGDPSSDLMIYLEQDLNKYMDENEVNNWYDLTRAMWNVGFGYESIHYLLEASDTSFWLQDFGHEPVAFLIELAEDQLRSRDRSAEEYDHDHEPALVSAPRPPPSRILPTSKSVRCTGHPTSPTSDVHRQPNLKHSLPPSNQ